MTAADFIPWIPVFPLLGFLVNCLLYLVSHSKPGDKDAKPPVSVIDPKLQREALALIEQQVLSDKPYQFPPDLINKLAASNWNQAARY